MQYALFNKNIWKVLQEDDDQILLERNGDSIQVLSTKLNRIYPQLEASKLLEKCKPHIKYMESFGDVDELADIDSNMLLPYAEEFSATDTALTDFLNSTIQHVEFMLEAYPKRQEYKSLHLDGGPGDLNAIADVFNQEHPEANTLDVVFDSQHHETYICTQAICHIDNIVRIEE